MNLSNISGIRTMDDLQAQNASQTEELDRNAFLKLFTTQLQNQDPLDPVKNEAFIAQLGSVLNSGSHDFNVGLLATIHYRSAQ